MTTPRQRWGYGLPDQAYAEAPAIPATGQPPPVRAPRLEHLRGDLTGGIAAAVLTIPVSMGYGLLALSALGPDHVPQAILAGLYAPIFGCIIALVLGANTTMIYSPRSIVTFLIGALVAQSVVRSDVPFMQTAPLATLFAISLLLVFLAGFFQMLFGLLKFGSIVKFIPAPVIAGFQNAAAILIFFSQIDAMIGAREHVPAYAIALDPGVIRWPTLVVGIVTATLMLKGARITKKVPPTILGFAGGLACYYLFALAGLGAWLGPVVGPIPSALPDPRYLLDFAALLTGPEVWQLAPVLLSGALSLAIIASLDAVLCARLIQIDTGIRVQDNRELVRLGVGNMVAAGFGGIANGVNLGSSFANHRSGARTQASVLFHAAAILLVIVLLSPLISYVPRVVIAGMLTVIAIQLVDRWTLQILKKILTGEFATVRRLLLDLLVIVLVTIAAVAVNIVLAVLIGTAVTVLFFLFRMSKSVIRRSYRCDKVHSRRQREPKHMEILSVHGSKIMVLELEGPIFFGTAENLALYVEAELRERTYYVILDMKRVNDVDSTGAKILVQLHDRLTKVGKFLLLSNLEEHTQLESFLNDMGVMTALTQKRVFRDTDRAIEWSEDHAILAQIGDLELGAEFPYALLDVFAGFEESELEVIKAVLERRVYAKGETVFGEGDETKELYVIAKGTASVQLSLPGGNRETRLITFSPGTVFGELSLLDQEARSASVEADEELVCYVLSHAAFEALTREHPPIAIKLLTNLGRELSGRLRRANRTIYELAS